jgi:uronate dehydrogenase
VAATTSTTVVALRIGYFAIEPPDLEQVPTRDLTAWLSARDAAELVRAAVESEGLTFVVANGISANRFRRADIEQTVSRLGYQPVDDAWARLTDRELRSGRHG